MSWASPLSLLFNGQNEQQNLISESFINVKYFEIPLIYSQSEFVLFEMNEFMALVGATLYRMALDFWLFHCFLTFCFFFTILKRELAMS